MRDASSQTSKSEAAELSWSRLLHSTLQHGFYGTLAIEVTVQDGTIQKTCERVERVTK